MARLLLIGNSRWHWAEAGAKPWRCWHELPPEDGGPPAVEELRAWAAVGGVPPGDQLPRQAQLQLADVPLSGMPPWLGVDRALVGWGAWRQQGHGVLVADAGTALSLTRVDGSGCFRGGRISAGVGLQLRSLQAHTAQLPAVELERLPQERWPIDTPAAMVQGCVHSVAAAIAQAWTDARQQEPDQRWALWLTGGDAALLLPLLVQQQLEPVLAPDLAMQALAALPAVGLLP